ncbi:CPCC family cysteine-rich protein [Chryseobacterium profundimaris]|uniref:Cysteine-rich CPCC n=1 Tax=Chryseobacterium profundimaris TaxID=1387275 RepID=A0ABY1N995_9FLAO|nr:CPCC family cysteine-rich protein [Chryseobacterium profundimaris]SMP03937.1 Cysteine-rich CPCC [Chryseobacterium profundimaris]
MKEEITNLNVQCYCCGYYTLEERGHYEICPVCFWEDGGGFELKFGALKKDILEIHYGN